MRYQPFLFGDENGVAPNFVSHIHGCRESAGIAGIHKSRFRDSVVQFDIISLLIPEEPGGIEVDLKPSPAGKNCLRPNIGVVNLAFGRTVIL